MQLRKPFPFSLEHRPRVLVVGDLMLDHYIHGEASRLSPEAPVPVVFFENEDMVLGGAGNVAYNLLSLGAIPVVAGCCGDDVHGDLLQQSLQSWGDNIGHLLVRHCDLTTTVKTRVLAAGQQLIRIDREARHPLPESLLREVLENLPGLVYSCEAVIISDYLKGFCDEKTLRLVIESARQREIPVLIDPKGRDWQRYEGANVVTPNRREAEEVCGWALGTADELAQAGAWITSHFGIGATLITLGAEGMYVYQPQRDTGTLLPTVARGVFDVAGAGDTVIATLALALLDSRDLVEAAHLSNLAAGIVVGKPGVAVIKPGELAARILEEGHDSGKIAPTDVAEQRIRAAQAQGQSVVFTNGIFDLLRTSHLKYLRQARALGDMLVVGINSDSSVRRFKQDPRRPLMNQHDRGSILGALDCVDLIVVFDEEEPVQLLEVLRPDILVKGDNYRPEEVVGRELVIGYGGRVELIPLSGDHSVTDFLDRLMS